MNDDADDGQQAMWADEMERDTLDVLDRFARIGAKFDDLYFIAAQLGVGERFRKAHAPRA